MVAERGFETVRGGTVEPEDFTGKIAKTAEAYRFSSSQKGPGLKTPHLLGLIP
jgi:hypothetical protein